MTETHPIFTLHQGTKPLLVSLPHAGQAIPHWLAPRLTPLANRVLDTDWYLDELYAFAKELGASVLQPHFSRYVVDLNRPPDNQPMYPGQNNTELCPTRNFEGTPIYQTAQAPNDAEIGERVQTYWQPYHHALQAELDRIKTTHGHAMLWDGHSILNPLPWLFDGNLPDLNIGTANGAACSPALEALLLKALQAQSTFTFAVNGRFKGGYITRQYGKPAQGVHAVQLEQCFQTYMDCGETYDQTYVWNASFAANAMQMNQTFLNIMLGFRA